MVHVIPYALPYSIPATMAIGYAFGGLTGFAVVFWIYIAVPWIDSLLGRRRAFDLGEIPPPGPVAERLCRALLWLWVPTQAAMLWGALLVVERHDLGPLKCWAVACSLGLAGGVIGFTVVHELAHTRHTVEAMLATVLAAMFGYPHFCIEHVQGHHRRVATPEDPATARLGESLYAFVIRSVCGGLTHSWQIEAGRLRARGRVAWSAGNRVLQGMAAVLLLVLAIWAAFGWRGVGVFAAQCVVSIFLLEATNYVQHYGLRRREVAPGKYEPVSALHSWNVEHRLTNWLLFNLGRHSEHHCEPARPYQQLNCAVPGPVLPLGLAGMVVLSFFPPVWWLVMDRRVAYWRREGREGPIFEQANHERRSSEDSNE
ncbi:MAG: alkane 1-monooxygenase [Pirellulaceae bacterium]|nr:alkane 1-monooxygenase [Pirellulaceae bacterium]